MTTKSEQQAAADAAQRRMDQQQVEADRQTHLVDPLTHPSSGDPPPAISPAGDRLGAVPMTRNAVADLEQAKQEGLEAAEKNQPTKAEREASKPRGKDGPQRRAGKTTSKDKSTAEDSKAKPTASATEQIKAKRDEAADKTQTPTADAMEQQRPFGTHRPAEDASRR